MGGMLDSAHLLVTMKRLLAETGFIDYGRRITLLAADVETGNYVEFDKKNLLCYDAPRTAVGG